MARTESNMLPLGTKAPEFSLYDPKEDRYISLEDLKSSKATVVTFICNHCPFVIHILRGFVDLTNEYSEKGVSFVGINSNDVENYPEDSPDKMSIVAKVMQFPFPYLYDESQDVAKAYHAACTPDFYVFDENMKLVYRGQMDGSRPGNDVPVTGKDLRRALDAVMAGKDVEGNQFPSIGCNIKWRK